MTNTNDFLPKDYNVPSTSNYFKFEQGENVIRILSSAILGYVYWRDGQDGKPEPVRSKTPFASIPADTRINPKTNKKEAPKHFWAFVVWNYNDKSVQIMELTQETIQRPIRGLAKNPKWGDPKNYDLTITKTGENMLTKYSVMPNPHTEIDKSIEEAYIAKNIKLEALYDGNDPFGGKTVPVPADEHTEPIESDIFDQAQDELPE